MKYKIVCMGALMLFSNSLWGQKAQMNLSIEKERLSYNVSYEGRSVIDSSPLGLNVDNVLLGKDVNITPVETKEQGGKCYDVKHKGTLSFYIDVREFDDGVAFRYRIPSEGPRCIYGEQTAFTFPASTRVWYASGPFQYGWIQAYQERTVDSLENELLAPPATFRLPDGTYAAITEANLFQYHGAVLLGEKENRVRVGYVENKGHLETGTITGIPASKYWHEVVKDVPWIVYPDSSLHEIRTPWRVLMLAKDLNGLVNNRIIAQVCDKPDQTLFPEGQHTSWIRPGRSVFTWLVEG